MAGFGDFTSDCGQNKTATSDTGLLVNQQVRVNGNSDLSPCVVANDEACVYGITLTGSPGIYDYVVNVDCQGPRGFGSGSMYLAFRDGTGDVYYLSIYSSHRSTHTVRYNSQDPKIIAFRWSNTSFDW